MEVPLVPRERAVGSPGSLPGLCRVDEQVHGPRGAREPLLGRLREHRAAAERDHGRIRRIQRLGDHDLLERAELSLSALVEELRDRPVTALDLLVRVDERAADARGDVATDRRLPRAHEADESEVLAERAYVAADHGIRST